MEFTITNIKKSVNDMIRTIGYKPAYFSGYARSRVAGQNEKEISIVRQVSGNDYPRFHLYIKKVDSTIDQSMGLSYLFKLHLDQKKPSYKGAKGHSGEYDGSVVEGEASRIKNLLL